MHTSPREPNDNAAKVASTQAMIDRTESRVHTTLEWMVEATATLRPDTAEKITEVARIANASRVAIAEACSALAKAEETRDVDQAKFQVHLKAAVDRTNDAWVLSDLAADKIDQLQYAASLARAR